MSPVRQLALLWTGVALALVAFSPVATRLAAGAPSCPIRTWFDLPCLSCGTTRAALALARFDPGAALAYNPLAALGWMGLVAGGLVAGCMVATGRPLPRFRIRPTLALRLTAAAILIANWAYLIHAGI